MKVWVVIHSEEDSSTVHGVFASRASAGAEVARIENIKVQAFTAAGITPAHSAHHSSAVALAWQDWTRRRDAFLRLHDIDTYDYWIAGDGDGIEVSPCSPNRPCYASRGH